MELADQNSDDENDDNVNVEKRTSSKGKRSSKSSKRSSKGRKPSRKLTIYEENETDSDEEVEINFIEEEEHEQEQQREYPQLLQDAIREQQQIQALENQLAAERVLLRMNPNNE